MMEAALGALGVVITVTGTVIVARLNARSATIASTKAAASADLAGAAAEWRAIADMRRGEQQEDKIRFEELEKRLAAVTREQAHDQAHSLEQDHIIEELRRVISGWIVFGQDLVTRWEFHRVSDKPPTLPEMRDQV